MTFPSHFHMPGAFHPDGVHPGLFRPPVSPSDSTDYLSSSAFTTEAASKRKWSRSNVPRAHEAAAAAVGDGYFDGEAFMDGTPSSRPGSRVYALAGQLDTPGTGPALDDTQMLEESMFSDSDYRRALGSKRSRDEMDFTPNGPMPLFNLPEKPAPALGWGSFAVATLGGVVGRVWQFCRTGGFKGFYAGGGEPFKMTDAGSISEASDMPEPRPDETYFFQGNQGNDSGPGDGSQHVPGQFPHGRRYYPDTADDTPYDSGASTPTGPAAKRRHMDQFNELGRNWVMIQEPNGAMEKKTPRRTPASHHTSPRNRKQTASADRRIATPVTRHSAPTLPVSTPRRPASRAGTSRPSSRMSDVGSLRPPRPASAASFASFTGKQSPTPSRIPVKAASTASVASPASMSTYNEPRRRRNSAVPPPSAPPSRMGHRRTNSAASTASGRGDDSPRLDAEAKHLAARRKMEERDTDFRMAAFNKRLQDMIRQGKEALGTTIEVDVNEEGGWEDDD